MLFSFLKTFTKVDHIPQNKTQLNYYYLMPEALDASIHPSSPLLILSTTLSTTLSVLCPGGKLVWAIRGQQTFPVKVQVGNT